LKLEPRYQHDGPAEAGDYVRETTVRRKPDTTYVEKFLRAFVAAVLAVLLAINNFSMFAASIQFFASASGSLAGGR
jgi:hypothetical protein